ncbi:calmodulin-dependent protein kinase [Pelomyxa schiedti]|nr:calmodulin-dependent protein kinase [Pelomyxa schiedti]
MSAIDTRRNEAMMRALFELQVGNIDSALALVANASSLFEAETSSINHNDECDYLPGLLFLVCLRCVINDHVSLHHHIPPCLSRAFSRAISFTTLRMRAHCVSVLSHINATSDQHDASRNKTAVIAEWADLVSTAVSRANVDNPHQQGLGHSWSCMHFVALWRLYCCSSPTGNHPSSSSAAHIFSEMSGATKMPAASTATSRGDEHSTSPLMINCSVGQILWSASSVTSLGLCYDHGVGGVGKDIHKAVALYQKAADAGSAQAMCNLGLCYFNGDGVDKDFHKAVALWQNAADTGNSATMCILGMCYEHGQGVDSDIHKAVALWQKAADAGDAQATSNLGSFYYDGKGVDKDMRKAVTLFQRAADCGDPQAMCNLGWCYNNGDGVGKDFHKAVQLYQRASDAGHAGAMCSLGVCYYKGDGVGKDAHKAMILYQRAADGGSVQAMCNLAFRYRQGIDGFSKDIHEAMRLWLRAANLGHANSIAQLGILQSKGNDST